MVDKQRTVFIGPTDKSELVMVLNTKDNEVVSVEIYSGRNSVLLEGKETVYSVARCLVGWCARSYNERFEEEPPDTEPTPEPRNIA
jgi:hypothetical protein